MKNADINEDFLNDFDYIEKNNYYWDISICHRDGKTRNIFYGKNKKNNNDDIFVKQIIISPLTYNTILREIYFLLFIKNKEYFVDLYDMRINKDKQKIFLLFKGNNIDLFTLINSKSDNLSNEEFIKWIIYQITFGLYFLHSNKIIHNNLNPSSILINEEGGAFIWDLGSATYQEETSYDFSLPYSAPEFLNGNPISNEKLDMWGLGIIMLELFLKKNKILKVESQDNNNRVQLKFILSKFGINENISNEEIDKLIKDEKNPNEIILDNNQIENIGDPNAIDLIKHLLTLNPKKRYTAEQVLKSKYLEEYLNLDIFNLPKMENPINYKKLSDDMNIDLFLKIYDTLYSTLKNLNKTK